jgi:hypothetical protein
MAHGRRALWEKRVAQWVECGQGGAEFAARLGVKESTLRHWKWQLGHDARQRGPRRKSARPKFVEVAPAVSAQLVGGGAFEFVFDSGLRVKVPAAFDETALRRLLAVLEGR